MDMSFFCIRIGIKIAICYFRIGCTFVINVGNAHANRTTANTARQGKGIVIGFHIRQTLGGDVQVMNGSFHARDQCLGLAGEMVIRYGTYHGSCTSAAGSCSHATFADVDLRFAQCFHRSIMGIEGILVGISASDFSYGFTGNRISIARTGSTYTSSTRSTDCQSAQMGIDIRFVISGNRYIGIC